MPLTLDQIFVVSGAVGFCCLKIAMCLMTPTHSWEHCYLHNVDAMQLQNGTCTGQTIANTALRLMVITVSERLLKQQRHSTLKINYCRIIRPYLSSRTETRTGKIATFPAKNYKITSLSRQQEFSQSLCAASFPFSCTVWNEQLPEGDERVFENMAWPLNAAVMDSKLCKPPVRAAFKSFNNTQGVLEQGS